MDSIGSNEDVLGFHQMIVSNRYPGWISSNSVIIEFWGTYRPRLNWSSLNWFTMVSLLILKFQCIFENWKPVVDWLP